MAKDNLRAWKFIGVAAVAVVIVLIFVNLGQRTTYDVSEIGNPSVGDGNLTVYLFEDYECSHCAGFTAGENQFAFDHLMETWVDAGKVRIVFKHVDIVAPTSADAARASRCVYDQVSEDAWLEWDHAVYARQVTSGGAFQASEANLEPITRDWAESYSAFDIGLYKDCLKADAELDAITEQNVADFRNAGIGGTPGLLVGNQVVNPTRTADVDAAIQAAIDAMEEDAANGA